MTLTNVPRIRDVETMLELVADLGVDVESTGDGRVRIHAADTPQARARRGALHAESAPRSCSRGRCSRAGARRSCRRPGGDVIGRRRLDTHIHAFEQLGADIEVNRRFHMRSGRLVGARSSSTRRPSPARRTRSWPPCWRGARRSIGNAACEPHVQDLCRFLVALGARHRGHRLERPPHPRRRPPPRRRVAHLPGPHRGGELHRPRRRHRRRDRRSRTSCPSTSAPSGRASSGSGSRCARRGHDDPRSRPPGAGRPGRHRLPDPEDRGRPVAGLPGRPHLDRRSPSPPRREGRS